MKKKLLYFLIFLDLFWSIAALIYDLPAIHHIPFYFWPLIIICPIFPLLLAIVWYEKLRTNHINSYLLAFAAIPSAAYFIGALIYYPTLMSSHGFNWLEFGTIFWVAFYGLQGFYLIFANQIKIVPIMLSLLFLALSFVIQYIYKTYEYLDIQGLSNQIIIMIYSFTLLNLIIYIYILGKIRLVWSKLN